MPQRRGRSKNRYILRAALTDFIKENSTWDEPRPGSPRRLFFGQVFRLVGDNKWTYIVKHYPYTEWMSERKLDEFLTDFGVPFEQFREYHDKWIDKKFPKAHELFFQD